MNVSSFLEIVVFLTMNKENKRLLHRYNIGFDVNTNLSTRMLFEDFVVNP